MNSVDLFQAAITDVLEYSNYTGWNPATPVDNAFLRRLIRQRYAQAEESVIRTIIGVYREAEKLASKERNPLAVLLEQRPLADLLDEARLFVRRRELSEDALDSLAISAQVTCAQMQSWLASGGGFFRPEDAQRLLEYLMAHEGFKPSAATV